jgi:hypothetical protein
MSLRCLVEPCENGGCLLRIGLNFGLGEVSRVAAKIEAGHYHDV